ncbi:MAG: hypothetical protein FWD79_09580 [Desulfobulbus sp.]|nr:hypothetical protein [Desulfobulbus sp.]
MIENNIFKFKRSPVDWKFDISQIFTIIKSDEETLEKPQRTLELKTQRFKEIDPSWELVEETLHAVEIHKHHFDYNNFCILGFISSPENYIQTVYCSAGGWRLEWREYYLRGGYTHYFAQISSNSEDGGTIQQFQAVIDAFHAFYYNKSWTEDLIWLAYNI